MRRAVRFLAVPVIIGALLWSNPSVADIPPVDETRDIIVGRMDAPNTLLIYFSPGCVQCVELQSYIIIHLARDHVVPGMVRDEVHPGDLRLAVRMVPAFIGSWRAVDVPAEDRTRALALSRLLASALHCSYDSDGQAGFIQSQSALIELHLRNEMAEVQPDFRWPYGTNETSRTLFYRLLEQSGMEEEGFRACTAGEGQTRLLRRFNENQAGFEAAGYTALPALFFNGAPVSMQSGFTTIVEGLVRQLSERTSSEADAAFNACRQREAGIRLGVPESDVAGLVAGINNPSARPAPYHRRGGNFWSNVADAWQRAAWTCGRY